MYHWGLPHTRFEQALGWNFGHKPGRGNCPIVDDDGVVRHALLPSWSWLGWTGYIMAGDNYSRGQSLEASNGDKWLKF